IIGNPSLNHRYRKGFYSLFKTLQQNRLIDKAVDVFTAGQKAQEFLSDKSQEAIYKTSEYVLNDAERQEKVVGFAENSLESLLNLNSDEKLEVDLSLDDLSFVIVDKK
ncbi:hypothetical protein ACHBIF_09545, partial [Streptococcus sp. A11]